YDEMVESMVAGMDVELTVEEQMVETELKYLAEFATGNDRDAIAELDTLSEESYK
nr:14-3-3 protein isoform epsilon - sheep (fragments) [Ovis aries]